MAKKQDPVVAAFEKFRKAADLPPTVNQYAAMRLAWLGGVEWARRNPREASAETTQPDAAQ